MKAAILTVLLIAAVALVGLSAWLWTPDIRRPKLEATYLRAPEDLIDMGGFRLHVRDTGSREAPAVVMLHGFGSSLHTFEPWARALQGEYRVIRFDLPGSGLSEPDPSGVYTDARSMDILLALLDRLGVRRAALIGNSIGGRLAWRFAAAHPDRVDKLVLISPDGFASPGFEYGRKPDVPAVLTLMRFVLPKMLLRPNLVAAYGDPAALTEETLERYHALMLAPGSRAAMIERMRQTVLVDPEPILREIGIPVLLLWGAKDAMIPIANAADYMRALPHGKLVTLPSLGHVPHEESPEISVAPVREFLAGG
jgi:pimeloyl-ACP methyl ester carboxylesterase